MLLLLIVWRLGETDPKLAAVEETKQNLQEGQNARVAYRYTEWSKVDKSRRMMLVTKVPSGISFHLNVFRSHSVQSCSLKYA